MQKLLIKGGKKLSGEVVISGSKNASLPIIISSLLFDDTVLFENVPQVKDIYTLINLIRDWETERAWASLRSLWREPGLNGV